jgi:hypothetical protein
MKISALGKTIYILLTLSFLGYWWFENRYWRGIDPNRVTINGGNLSGEYAPVKSLGGNLFFRHFDHYPQYLVSVSKQEVYTISEDEDSIYFFDIYTSDNLIALENPNIKQKLHNADLKITKDTIEFTGARNELWKIKR